MPAPHGFSIAFGAGALDATPTWTRMDTLTDLAVQRYTIHRGRVDEHDKTGVGTATVTGIDLGGVVDPTNTGNAFYTGGATQINPTKQAAICLQNPCDDTWSTLFRGYVADWDFELDLSQRFTSFEVGMVDLLDILSDAEVVPASSSATGAGRGAGVPSGSLPSTLNAGDAYYLPQTVQDRIFAALADAALSAGATEWPDELMTIFTGNVWVQGVIYSPRTSILQVIQDAADAEFPGVANFYASKDGIATFHGRYARFDYTDFETYGINQWTVGDLTKFAGDATTAVMSGLNWTRGKTNLINAAMATPSGLIDRDIRGQFSYDATSIAKYGARSVSFEGLLTQRGNEDPVLAATEYGQAKAETKLFADYYIDNFKDPKDRIKQIKFRTQDPDGPYGQPVWDLICGVEISDVLSVTSNHPGGGGFADAIYFVEGITYEIEPMTATYPNVTLTLDVSPASYYANDPFRP